MLTIDHVTIAGPRLEAMQTAFTGLGLAPDYGGPHSNGITHMALLGFRDGSYIELISSLEPGRMDPAFWGHHIVGNGGPCAWAVQVADVTAEAARLAGLGITVQGPTYYNRQRPDGQLVEWDLAFVGDKGAGATLPFIINDITPRDLRVQPSASVVDGPLWGVAKVVLGVKDLVAGVALFQEAYGWPAPQQAEAPLFGARLAHFAGSPVILAEPLASDNWLARRLTHFGDSPCAYLLGSADWTAGLENSAATVAADVWFGQRVVWFDPDKLAGGRLGVIEQPFEAAPVKPETSS